MELNCFTMNYCFSILIRMREAMESLGCEAARRKRENREPSRCFSRVNQLSTGPRGAAGGGKSGGKGRGCSQGTSHSGPRMPQPRGRTSTCLTTTRTQESPLIRPRQSPQVPSRNSPSTTLVSKLRSALPRSAALRAPRCGLRVLCSRARDVALAPQLHPAGGAWFRTKLKSVDS